MVDLTIIGGGAAGCHAAMLAARAGFSVVLIENSTLGGCAQTDGYWPFRSLLLDAATVARGRDGFLGLQMSEKYPIYDTMLGRMHTQMKALGNRQLENLQSLGVEVVRAAGHVKGLRNHRYVVTTGDNFYESRRLLLAMGSVPAVPDLPEVEKHVKAGNMITPFELINRKLPQKAAVLGSGLKGLQMAAWLAAQLVPVTVIERQQTIAPEFDADVSAWLKQRLTGIQFVTDAKLVGITGEQITLTQASGGLSIPFDTVVLGDKRWPATRGLGLNNAAIATENGAVITDLTCHTNLPDVYAAGDVSMRTTSQLGAVRQAEVSVANMLGQRTSLNMRALPTVFDCGVQAASVGETTATAQAMGTAVAIMTLPIEGHWELGFCKLVMEKSTRKLIGAHLCGSDGVEVIWELSASIEAGLTVGQTLHTLLPRTTMADLVQTVLLQL